MDALFQIKTDAGAIENLAGEVIAETLGDIAEDLAHNAPDDMRRLMPQGGGKHSERGNPPFQQSGTLARELRGEVSTSDPTEVVFSMSGYGGFLDPLFKDQDFKGAGHLERSFIMPGVLARLPKTLAEL